MYYDTFYKGAITKYVSPLCEIPAYQVPTEAKWTVLPDRLGTQASTYKDFHSSTLITSQKQRFPT